MSAPPTVTEWDTFAARVRAHLPTEPAPEPAPDPAPAPAAPPAEPPRGRLEIRPPELDNPIVKRIKGGAQTVTLDDARDYELHLDGPINVGTSGLTIDGGHNVALRTGGLIKATGSRRPFQLKGGAAGGTTYIEGVRISGANEGITHDQRATGHVTVLQSVLVDRIQGTENGHHADLLQTWGGGAGGGIICNRVDGTTTYQGFMIDPDKFGSDVGWYLRVLRSVIRKPSGGGYPFHKAGSSRHVLELDEVLIERPASAAKSRQVYGGDAGDKLTGVRVVTDAPTPCLGNPGADYQSPGYL